MRLYPSIAFENTIQHYHWTCYFSASTKEKKIIAFDVTAVKKYLIPASIEISRFCSAKSRNIMNNADVINGYAFSSNTDTIHSIKDLNISCPAISNATHGECPVMTFTNSY